MQPFYKDMLILCLTQTGIIFNMIWGLLLPYYSSFVHVDNKDITVKKMYATYIAFALGQLSASKVLAKYYYIFGIRVGFLVLSILNLFNTIFQINCTSLFMVNFVMLLYGIVFQSVVTGCNLYISEQYENGILYTKYLTAIRLVFYLIPLFISQIIINPYNETATVLSKNGEFFFGQHITHKFSTFILYFGLYGSLVISLGYISLKNTNQFRNRIAPFLNSIMGRSQFRFNMDKEEVRIIQSISIAHQSLKFTKNFKSFIKQRNSNLLESLPTQKSIKSELNPEIEEQNNKEGVLIISLICFICLTVYTYSNGMYKYISVMFKINDSTINAYYSISTILNLSGNFFAPYLWQNYPVVYSVIFLFVCNFSNLLLILSSQFNPYNFLYTIWIGRLQSGFQPMLGDLICFGLFEPMVAMEKIQLFAYGNLFANVLGTIMNFVLFSEKHWTLIFYVQLAMIIGALVYFLINFQIINKIVKKQLNQLKMLIIMFNRLKFNGQEEIVSYLNLIDKFYSNDHCVEKKESKKYVKNAIEQVQLWIENNIQKISIDIFISLYEFLVFLDKKQSFYSIFDDYKLSYVLYGNLAYLIQSSWDYQSKNTTNKANHQYISQSLQILQQQKNEIELEKKKNFFDIQKFNFCIAKGYLQLAASHSQFKMHRKALFQGKKCLIHINNLRKNLESLFNKKQQNKKISQILSSNQNLRKQFLNFF